MNIATRGLVELQEITLLAARAARGIVKRPRYIPETIAQMDLIGVGSLTIIVLTGFFTGGVLTLQTYPTLASYGALNQLGYLVALSLVPPLVGCQEGVPKVAPRRSISWSAHPQYVPRALACYRCGSRKPWHFSAY